MIRIYKCILCKEETENSLTCYGEPYVASWGRELIYPEVNIHICDRCLDNQMLRHLEQNNWEKIKKYIQEVRRGGDESA